MRQQPHSPGAQVASQTPIGSSGSRGRCRGSAAFSPSTRHDGRSGGSRPCCGCGRACVDALRGSRALLSLNCPVGCGFVSGLFARPHCRWPRWVSASRSSHFDFALSAHALSTGYLRVSVRPRVHPLLRLGLSKAARMPLIPPYAVCGAVDRYTPPRVSNAQMIRAALLASATVTTRAGRRASSCLAQTVPPVPRA